MSKRTIDYYTKLGLLQAERTTSNYRLYGDDAVRTLAFIEECKGLHIPLEEIKRKLEMKRQSDVELGEMEKHIHSIGQQVKQLQQDLSVLVPLMENLDDQQATAIKKQVASEKQWLLDFLPTLQRFVKFSN